MLTVICPRCGKDSLTLVGDGVYKCSTCGYMGKAGIDEDVFRK